MRKGTHDAPVSIQPTRSSGNLSGTSLMARSVNAAMALKRPPMSAPEVGGLPVPVWMQTGMSSRLASSYKGKK